MYEYFNPLLYANIFIFHKQIIMSAPICKQLTTKSSTIKQLIKKTRTQQNEAAKTIKVMPHKNAFQFRKPKNKQALKLDISGKIAALRYQSIQVDDLDTLNRKRMRTQQDIQGCQGQKSTKDINKFKRYRSIEYEGGQIAQLQRSQKKLKYLPKKGRILINLNTSSSSKALKVQATASTDHYQSKNQEERKKKLSSEYPQTCKKNNKSLSNIHPIKPIAQKNEQKNQMNAQKLNKKDKNRRFLTEISSTTQNLFKENEKTNGQKKQIAYSISKKDLVKIKNNQRSLKLKSTIQQGTNKNNIKLIKQIGNGTKSIFQKYLCQNKRKKDEESLKIKQKNRISDQNRIFDQRYEKMGSDVANQTLLRKKQSLEQKLIQMSQIVELNESGFLQNQMQKSFMQQLFGKTQIMSKKQLKEKMNDKKIKNDKLFSVQRSMKYDQIYCEESFEGRSNSKSRKNILRSIDKIKRAFPAGFFQGL